MNTPVIIRYKHSKAASLRQCKNTVIWLCVDISVWILLFYSGVRYCRRWWQQITSNGIVSRCRWQQICRDKNSATAGGNKLHPMELFPTAGGNKLHPMELFPAVGGNKFNPV